MKAYYVGAQRQVEAFGAVFERGKPTEVRDVYAKKIEGNPFFNTDGKPSDAAPAENEGDDTNATLEARHKGRGSYSIFGGAKELVSDLSKEDAEAFNAMSDEDKVAYVDKN